MSSTNKPKNSCIRYAVGFFSGSIIVWVGHLTNIINFIEAFESDGLFIKIFLFIEKEIKFPSTVTKLIIVIGLIICVIHLYDTYLKRKKVDATNPPFNRLLIILAEIGYIIIAIALFINAFEPDPIFDSSKYIGIVYNSRDINTESFENYLDEKSKIVQGRLGSDEKIKYYNIYNASNPIVAIDEFAKNERIRYLILTTKIDESFVDQLLERGKERFLLFKTIPFDISKNAESEIIAMYYAANQEVSAIIKSLAQTNCTEVLIIHPPLNKITNYEKEFVDALKYQSISHNINIRSFPSTEKNKVKALLDVTTEMQIPPIVLMSQNISDLDIINEKQEQRYRVFLSVNNSNEIMIKSLSKSEINIPIPWPIVKENTVPFSHKLVASVIETAIELDMAVTTKNGNKIKVNKMRDELFKYYDKFTLRLTQSLFGKTRLTKNNYPHLIVDNIDIQKINQ